ncbi:mitochondrial ribonuclease P catalytic subunit-like [Uloborus diversus]|uniref:mitochondrial ribonuclease P catalytic subunit-like n=1 Tax=Uloborus diversus TaxID=327109 RepID=UPI0024097746|nr:mitochondrial ribonuclease P catalytic subunit-like [Uloborus diversus]XP_054712678.1 mitochondrial ribonuclease P catalytic subunit-like [Uloborus diversus]
MISRFHYNFLIGLKPLKTFVCGLCSANQTVVTNILIKRCFSRVNIPPSFFKEGGYGSKYHPAPMNERVEERLKNMLLHKEILNDAEWSDIKNDIMTCYEMISECNFSTLVMSSLLHLNKIDLAHNFIQYLNRAHVSINFLTYMKYMSLCSKNVESCGEELILETFKKVKAQVDAAPVLDFKRTEYVVQALCATKYWRDSFEYLKKLPQKPTMDTYNALACAAVKNNDENLAWEIITKWIKPDMHPSSEVFKQFMLHALQIQKNDFRRADVFVLKIFNYIQSRGTVIDEDVANVIASYFKRHSTKWNVSVAKIEKNGDCSKCKKALTLLGLTDEEFTRLRLAFLERSVRKGDLFINTTEKEFNNFIRFIEGRKPFDVIVDGLNAAYMSSEKKNHYSLASQLLKVVKKLAEDNRKILILGRYQMNRWPKSILREIMLYARVFLTQNISQDDPFVVYAALSSGPKTRFVSSDLMRDHISRLDDPLLINLFKNWQQSHQIFLLPDDNGVIKFIEPLKHSITLQGAMDHGWHIPFDDKIILDPYEHLNNWLCIQR